MLNDELELDSVEIPPFMPLPELETLAKVPPRGYYIGCPHCRKKLRINKQYLNKKLNCKKCHETFTFKLSNSKIKKLGFYLDCPSCEERLKVPQKYAGQKVRCKRCETNIQLID